MITVPASAHPGPPSFTFCEDCGVQVVSTEAHTRFHSILSAHAWALAILKTAHIAAHVHDKYEAYDKINSKRFDSWSGDALAEVAAKLSASPEYQAALLDAESESWDGPGIDGSAMIEAADERRRAPADDPRR